MRTAVVFALALAAGGGAACQSGKSGTAAPGKLELVDAPATPDVAPLVAAELHKADHDGKRLLVYVGATWCEPCQTFHAAAAAGSLDRDFGSLRLLVFDADRDGDALVHAGYQSQLIPLFAVPTADGTSSGKQIEGSTKGSGAVDNIAPRLHALLGS